MSPEENKVPIPGPISENPVQDRLIEIQRRLESAESQKAVRLLSIAMTHHEAMVLVKKNIDKKLNGSFKRK
jgi:hypothetical protein